MLRGLIDPRKAPAQPLAATSIRRVHATLRSAVDTAGEAEEARVQAASFRVALVRCRRVPPYDGRWRRLAER
jgi:hypothetical protein